MINRQKFFDYGFMTLGILIQCVTYAFMPHDTWLSLLSGCLGVCSVCLSAQGNILTFVFGFAQVISINVFGSSIQFQPLLLPLTVAVSMLIAALSCMLPIKRAVQIDPALVLKGE